MIDTRRILDVLEQMQKNIDALVETIQLMRANTKSMEERIERLALSISGRNDETRQND